MSVHEFDTEAVYRLRARALPNMRRAAAVAVAMAAPPMLDPERTRPGNDLPYESHHTSFDNKIVIITGALLLLLLSLLLLHCLLRCFLRRLLHHPTSPPSAEPHPLPMKKRHIRTLPSATFHCEPPLPTATTTHVRASHCAICLADFTEGNLIRVLPTCQHSFHAACVDKWLQRQATCPTCRADILKRVDKSRSVEVVITPAGQLCPTLSGEPKDQSTPNTSPPTP